MRHPSMLSNKNTEFGKTPGSSKTRPVGRTEQSHLCDQPLPEIRLQYHLLQRPR